MVVVLAYLMVSRIRFRTFKDFRPRIRTLPVIFAIIVGFAVGVAVFKARLALVFAVGAYVALGLVEEVIFFKKRRVLDAIEREREAAPSDAPA